MAGLSRWEKLEEYLFDHDKTGSQFCARDYADDQDIDASEASARIQAYLHAQRNPKYRRDEGPLFVLNRVPGTRTRSARWKVGVRAANARQIGSALHDDVAARVRRALVPDLRRIAIKNPRAAKLATRQIEAIVDGAMKVLEAAVAGSYDDDPVPDK